MSDQVDVVITWVNGNDPQWLAKRHTYDGLVHDAEGNNAARYRDWDTLKYVLRGIEENLPWVRKVFLVTDGQKPSWFKEGGKVYLVDHKDFIPQEYLPAFSSHPIENNVFRIPDLSEQFILFNDDTIILRPMSQEEFFLNGKVRDIAALHIHCEKKSLMIYRICNNDISLINEHFEFKQVMSEQHSDWLNLKYSLKTNLKTLFLMNCPRFPGIEQTHMPQPYLKSTIKEVWDKEPEVLDETCRHKFRNQNDVNHWLFREWQLVKGEFIPVSQRKRGILIDFEKHEETSELKKCCEIIRTSDYQMICVNDGDTIHHVDTIREEVDQALSDRFPHKCSAEL